jgi:hypothetical protein
MEWAPFQSFPLGTNSGEDSETTQTCWFPCQASSFNVRNVGYSETREKIPSDFALYETVGVDLIRDKQRIDSLMDLLPQGLPESLPGTPEWDPTWGIPRVVITNCQLPYKSGSLFSKHPEDDAGFSLVIYSVLSPAASVLLTEGQWTPGLALWRRFVDRGVSTISGTSLKALGRVNDIERHRLSEDAKFYINKPVLVTESSKILKSRLPELLEIDFDVRMWSFAARSALVNYHPRAKDAELDIGLLIEGKTDEELPEQILGCVRIKNIDILAAKFISA